MRHGHPIYVLVYCVMLWLYVTLRELVYLSN